MLILAKLLRFLCGNLIKNRIMATQKVIKNGAKKPK